MQANRSEPIPSSETKLIPLKCAAADLGLTTEGLRQRIIRLRKGVRLGGRWFVPEPVIADMRRAAAILGRI
jgi:hypothetical protein